MAALGDVVEGFVNRAVFGRRVNRGFLNSGIVKRKADFAFVPGFKRNENPARALDKQKSDSVVRPVWRDIRKQ